MGRHLLARARKQLSYANVMSTIAVFVALCGGAYAIATAPKNSVVSKSIKNGQVKQVDLAAGLSVANAANAGNANTLDGTDSTVFAHKGSDGWTAVDLADDPAWCNYIIRTDGSNDAAFFRDPAGVVHLRGFLMAVDGDPNPCGASGNDFIINRDSPLPLGYRPAKDEHFIIRMNDKAAGVDVWNSGDLLVRPLTWADAEQDFSLDGISWRCAPSGANGCP